MKKFLTILLLMVAVCAQAQHMKFMNIPLDIPIDSFQVKLAEKGITLSKDFYGGSNASSRCFEGTFCDYNAQFFAYYNKKTKIVYRCKACIEDTSIDYITDRFNELKGMLAKKYKSNCEKEDTQDGYDTFSMLIMNDGNETCDWDASLGIINLYISESVGLSNKRYILHIDYYDRINYDINEDTKYDDL